MKLSRNSYNTRGPLISQVSGHVSTGISNLSWFFAFGSLEPRTGVVESCICDPPPPPLNDGMKPPAKSQSRKLLR